MIPDSNTSGMIPEAITPVGLIMAALTECLIRTVGGLAPKSIKL